MAETNGRKHAVVLSGGGGYGAFEVGVMKALFHGECAATNYQPLDAPIFTGTSVGAINAAFMTSQPGQLSADTVNDLEQLWLQDIAENPQHYGNRVFRFRFDLLDFLKLQGLRSNPLQPFTQMIEDVSFLSQDFFNRITHFFQASESLEHRILGLLNLSSFITVDPLRQLLREKISCEGIRRSDKILRIIATNWITGEVDIFRNEDMTESEGVPVMMASAAMPGFFPPVLVKGQPAVDGGVVMNTPLIPALQAGADVIHLVYLDPDPKNVPLEKLANTLDTIDRMMTIQLAININEDLATVDWINRGLHVMERVARGEMPSDDDAREFVRVASLIEQRIQNRMPYKKITVHRYRPRHDLGGVMGFLNFNRDRIAELINIGVDFARQYDPATESIIPD